MCTAHPARDGGRRTGGNLVNESPRNDPTFEGRPLPRPHEEVVDQGLAFDLGTLIGRRSLLRAFGLGAATLGLAACGNGDAGENKTTTSTAAASDEIPGETAGPYPGDGSNGPDVLEQ